MSQLVQLGVSHTSVPLRWRERLVVGGRDVGPAAARLAQSAAVGEALVLSTCSRVEAYAIGPDASRVELELLRRFAQRAGCPFEELATVVDVRHDADAARHLLRTAAGLESPVLGEHEILGQLRRAHRSAATTAAAGPVLDQLVTRAARTGRRVRTQTGLSTGPASLMSTVVTLARGLVGDSAGRRALVVGRTRTARAAAERLLGQGWSVTSASAAGELAPALPAFDVLVACSGGEVAIGRSALEATARGRDMPLLVVDLSVPRDVDPAARAVPGVLLYDVDDVAEAAQHAVAARQAHVPAAEEVVEDELRRFQDWLATRALVPTIKALREHQRRAVAEVLGELPEDVVERLVTRLLHDPTVRLREAAASGAGEQWAETARELFGLSGEAVDRSGVRAGRPRRRRAADGGR